MMLTAFKPDISPLGPMWLSALIGLLPLVTMFVTLGVLRWKAHIAGLTALAVAILVAVLGWKMPIVPALSGAVEGCLLYTSRCV